MNREVPGPWAYTQKGRHVCKHCSTSNTSHLHVRYTVKALTVAGAP